MNKILLLAVALIAISCGARQSQAEEKPIVYMTTEITPEALVKIYESLDRPAEGRVAVKISTGEPGGHNFLKPSLIKDLVQKVGGTIVECNTAYPGRRMSSEDHMEAAREHGFLDIAEVDIMDSEGEIKLPVQDTTHIKYNIVGSHIENYDFLINLAHFKGHGMAGFGGVIKNQSIGIASSNGKTYIHSAGASEDMTKMMETIAEQDKFLESMVASAQSVSDYFGDKIVYINVMNNLSVDCDCDSHPADPMMLDVGIFASLDPVALDQACVDYVFNMELSEGNDKRPLVERIQSRNGQHTLDYAAALGMGSKEYELQVLTSAEIEEAGEVEEVAE